MTEESAPPETVIDVAATEIPREKASRKRGWSVAAAGLAVLLAVVIALAGTSPYWAPPLATVLPWSPHESDQRIAALQQQVGVLEQRIQELAGRKPAPAPDEAAVKQLAARVAALEGRPAGDAGATAAIAALKSEIARLDIATARNAAQIDRLGAARGAQARMAERELFLAVVELRNAVETSAPFADQLAAVAALAQGAPDVTAALEPLKAEAATGLPSASVLAQRFESETAPAILRARGGNAAQDKGWGERALAAVKSLVVIKRVDQGPADAARHPVEAAVDAAKAALRQHDLAGAVKALGALQGPAAEAAAPWLEQAQKRLAAEAAVARLNQTVAARLQRAGSAPAPDAPDTSVLQSPSR